MPAINCKTQPKLSFVEDCSVCKGVSCSTGSSCDCGAGKCSKCEPGYSGIYINLSSITTHNVNNRA
jgi:hypothetical protein